MNISGVRPYSTYYNDTKAISNEIDKINSISLETEKKPGNQKELRYEEPQSERQLQPSASFTAYDYAKGFDPLTVYEHKGNDSSLSSLDMEQAISDKHKEQLMKQYQLFVGNRRQGVTAMYTDHIQAVRPVENFVI